MARQVPFVIAAGAGAYGLTLKVCVVLAVRPAVSVTLSVTLYVPAAPYRTPRRCTPTPV